MAPFQQTKVYSLQRCTHYNFIFFNVIIITIIISFISVNKKPKTDFFFRVLPEAKNTTHLVVSVNQSNKKETSFNLKLLSNLQINVLLKFQIGV